MISYINRKDWAYSVRLLVCDDESDVVDLPIDGSPGSLAFVIESGNMYIFGSNGEWSLKKGGGGGSSPVSVGRFLSTWNSTTGYPMTEPKEIPYQYKTGDYYIVAYTGSPNYLPIGKAFTGEASAEIETNPVNVSDMYYFDGEIWTLLDFSTVFDTYLKKEEAQSTYVSKVNSGTETMAGRLQVGNHTTNITNAFLHVRKVSSSVTGREVNGAGLAVNSDGTATIQHKTYNSDGTGAKNAAILRVSNKGLQFAINTGSGNTPTEDMYHNVLTEEYYKAGNGIKIENGVISIDLNSAEGELV